MENIGTAGIVQRYFFTSVICKISPRKITWNFEEKRMQLFIVSSLCELYFRYSIFTLVKIRISLNGRSLTLHLSQYTI